MYDYFTNILSYLSLSDAAVCARTCKEISGIARMHINSADVNSIFYNSRYGNLESVLKPPQLTMVVFKLEKIHKLAIRINNRYEEMSDFSNLYVLFTGNELHVLTNLFGLRSFYPVGSITITKNTCSCHTCVSTYNAENSILLPYDLISLKKAEKILSTYRRVVDKIESDID